MWQLHSPALKRGPRVILQNVAIDIAPGERVALLGASGAGKSTLLTSFRRRYPDDAAWCPQDPGLVPMLSVFHNIYMGRLAQYSAWKNLRNLVRPQSSELNQVESVATDLGINALMYTSVDRLSGGQVQRTALGRALYMSRPLLLADEPVSSLDEHQAQQLLETALAAHQASLVALHDRSLALQCCTRVIGLRHGQIVMDEPAASLTLTDLDRLYQ